MRLRPLVDPVEILVLLPVETFPLNGLPECERCGSRLHWYVDNHRDRRIDHRRQTCRDGRCPFHYPHSKYSPTCLSNPRGAVDVHTHKYGPHDDEPWLPEAVTTFGELEPAF